MDETDLDEPKVWRIEKPDDQLAVTSGAELLERLKATGTGEDKIAYGLSFFPDPDEDTGEVEDVPAKKLAKKFFKPDDGREFSDITLQKVKDIVETGTWKERPAPRKDPTAMLARVKKAKPKDEPKKAEKK